MHAWIEAAPICALLVDDAGVICEANREAAHLFGWPLQTLVGSSIEVLVPGPLRAEHAESRRRFAAAARHRVMGRESRLQARHHDGHLFPVDVMLSPVPGVGVMCIVVDRSEVVRFENELRESALTFRRVMDHVRDIVYVVRHEAQSLTGRVETVSAHVRDVLGYEAADFIDDPALWLSCVHPDDRDELGRSTTLMFEHKRPVLRRYRLRHRDTGQWRLIEDHSSPLLDEAGRIIGSCGAARDVTERVELRPEVLSSLTGALCRIDEALELAGTSEQGARSKALLSEARDGLMQMRSLLSARGGRERPDG